MGQHAEQREAHLEAALSLTQVIPMFSPWPVHTQPAVMLSPLPLVLGGGGWPG